MTVLSVGARAWHHVPAMIYMVIFAGGYSVKKDEVESRHMPRLIFLNTMQASTLSHKVRNFTPTANELNGRPYTILLQHFIAENIWLGRSGSGNIC